MCISDIYYVKTVTHHPVHIKDENGNLFPSALIPFCEFGNNPFSMGYLIPGFKQPVCDSFKAKIRAGQLCYEVDANLYVSNRPTDDKYNIQSSLKSGLKLVLDFNEDRQIKEKLMDVEKQMKKHYKGTHVHRDQTITIEKLFSKFEKFIEPHIFIESIGEQRSYKQVNIFICLQS